MVRFSWTGPYTGKCKALCKQCIGKDSNPYSRENGYVLCEYHGALIRKLRCLTYSELEYLMRNLSRPIIEEVMSLGGCHDSVPNTPYIHYIRLMAMSVSNEEWKRDHRIILNCPNERDLKRLGKNFEVGVRQRNSIGAGTEMLGGIL